MYLKKLGMKDPSYTEISVDQIWFQVWPDVEIESSPIFPIVVKKELTEVLYWKVQYFKIAPKVTKYSGLFLKKIYSQDLWKIAQSSHTE